jgi:hypothetical protein
MTNHLVADLLKYSGFVGVLFVVLYYLFKDTISKKFFITLSQKRKMLYLLSIPLLIWSTGILVIILNFMSHRSEQKNHQFFYQGQIVNEKGYPLKNAHAYIILKDTIRCVAETGSDGNFTIELDTLEGIKSTVYYGHPDYKSSSAFRTLSPSTNEQFMLKEPNKEEVNQKPMTFNINVENASLIHLLAQKTGLTYTPSAPSKRITLAYDKNKIDNFEGRYRYLGGKIKVYINNAFCCESRESLKATHDAGVSKTLLESQVKEMIAELAYKEKNELTSSIAACIKN